MSLGKLFLVGTPIGNLSDITLRALETLKNVDLIAAEDTRQTLKLLNHFSIKKPLISYHKYNEMERGNEIISKLKDGINIALVTDAGMPGISDPGSIVAEKCVEEGIEFEVIPGATAVITALVYSGLDTSSFIFKGFMPRENKDRREFLEDLKDRQETLIFYEAPHRLKKTLEFLKENLGNRRISICRELTKLHEEILRFTLEESIQYYNKNLPKGEFVLILEGKNRAQVEKEKMELWEYITIEEHIKKYIEKGMPKKEAIKTVAKDRNMPKSEVYKHSLNL
ncbi:16S rRNA (cytidine(1402)-2'-O)-methyltransferase [Haloimpatiens massiliensis]|uniref:16S rRNA (cytidine(1402)-2'-O)-methyltransferase n=1 Tax=Haloimpatiens massiliensis TaxID=1658110 RepID=UPI000C85A247|nr:16S rRNA (cytidine(1402)-2'-O)-methyltransferase [Haloimpatiens massiliensis]